MLLILIEILLQILDICNTISVYGAEEIRLETILNDVNFNMLFMCRSAKRRVNVQVRRLGGAIWCLRCEFGSFRFRFSLSTSGKTQKRMPKLTKNTRYTQTFRNPVTSKSVPVHYGRSIICEIRLKLLQILNSYFNLLFNEDLRGA